MSRFAAKTIRKLPSTTRDIARIANDVASVQTRLANRVRKLAELERIADASTHVRCTNDAHTNLVDAALGFVRSFDPDVSGRERTAAIGRLKDAAAYLDSDNLFKDEDKSKGKTRAGDESTDDLADHVADVLAGG